MTRPLEHASASSIVPSHPYDPGAETAGIGQSSDWLFAVFHRIRLITYAPLSAGALWFLLHDGWSPGLLVAVLSVFLTLDAIREGRRLIPRTTAQTLALDAVVVTALLVVGRFPVAVTVAAFSILITAGAMMLPWRDTIRFFGFLGVLGLAVGWINAASASPWNEAQDATLSILAIGVIPLIIVVTLVIARRETDVSRVLGRRLSAAESALRATEQRFGRAFGSAPSGLVITDLQGGIVQVNQAFAAMVGASREELMGTDLFALIDPTDTEITDDDFERLMETGSAGRLHDRRLVARDGRRIWTLMSVSLIDDGDGAPTGCVVHIMDVTGRKEASEKLETTNRRLQALHEITRAGLDAHDLAEAARRIVGVIQGVFEFPGVTVCVHDRERAVMRTVASAAQVASDCSDVEVGSALCANAALTNETYLRVSPAGEISERDPNVRTVLSVPLQIDDSTYGALTLTDTTVRQLDAEFVAQVENISNHVAAFLKRMQAEEQLEALVRSKDEFIASVSHEVRTPLTAVVGLAAELRDRHKTMDEAETDEIMEIVAEQSTEVANIVEDLLVAARSDLDSLSLRQEPIAVRDQVDRVLRELAQFVDGRPITITATGDALAFGDRGRFRQILRNLFTNAFRYGGPEITISAGHDGEYAFICVADNGPGIPEDDWETVFEPYRRSHNATGQPGSVGIGLTVSRKLARLMGGDLTYRFVGEASMFELRMPRARFHRRPLDASGQAAIDLSA